jgi:hypothetical protein
LKETHANRINIAFVFVFGLLLFSTNEIHHCEMQDDRGDKKIDKCAFGRNAELIGRIDLNAQAHTVSTKLPTAEMKPLKNALNGNVPTKAQYTN